MERRALLPLFCTSSCCSLRPVTHRVVELWIQRNNLIIRREPENRSRRHFVCRFNKFLPPPPFVSSSPFGALSLIRIKPGLCRLGNKLWRFQSHSPANLLYVRPCVQSASTDTQLSDKNPFPALVMLQSLFAYPLLLLVNGRTGGRRLWCDVMCVRRV